MKTLTIILLGGFFAIITFAKLPATKAENGTENGIAFHEGTWAEALQLAKQEGKPIFLDISASWCGPCKMLKARTFPNQEVGKFYNSNFINVAVDGEKGEGIELAQKYKIRGYPSLIFVDSNGKLIVQTAGYRNPKQFVELGKQIINR
jgi:thioredoxin-related protein